MTLRSRLIRLAHEQPTLRPHLLPILKTAEDRYHTYLDEATQRGWEVLEGPALDKARRVTRVEVDIARKYGRKTVFARYHGMVTLYLVRDDGTVAQDEFIWLPKDPEILAFVRTNLDPNPKTASPMQIQVVVDSMRDIENELRSLKNSSHGRGADDMTVAMAGSSIRRSGRKLEGPAREMLKSVMSMKDVPEDLEPLTVNLDQALDEWVAPRPPVAGTPASFLVRNWGETALDLGTAILTLAKSLPKSLS